MAHCLIASPSEESVQAELAGMPEGATSRPTRSRRSRGVPETPPDEPQPTPVEDPPAEPYRFLTWPGGRAVPERVDHE
jgi:hypothetical protein